MTMIHRFPGPAALLGVLALLGGCASSSARFEAVGQDGSLAPEARYFLQSDAGPEGSITLGVEGTRYDELDGRETDSVRIAFFVDNSSDDPITLELPKIAVADDQGHHYRPFATYLPPHLDPGDLLHVAPRERTSFEILFDTGGPGVLRSTGSLTVLWTYTFRSRTLEHRTRFLPVRYRYRESYYYDPYPRTGFFFSFGHGHYSRHHCWW